jgi:3D (Asp-Asp-Asp) domain-containing protein
MVEALMIVTAYCPCERCCGKWATGDPDRRTASGDYLRYALVVGGIAAPKRFPFRTLMEIPGYKDGYAVPVLDRRGKIKGNHLDVLFATHTEAVAWGRRELKVKIKLPTTRPARRNHATKKKPHNEVIRMRKFWYCRVSGKWSEYCVLKVWGQRVQDGPFIDIYVALKEDNVALLAQCAADMFIHLETKRLAELERDRAAFTLPRASAVLPEEES